MEHNHSMQQKEKIYTCPMHPEIKRDSPGVCPKCGMTLIKVDAQEKNNTHSGHVMGDPSKMSFGGS